MGIVGSCSAVVPRIDPDSDRMVCVVDLGQSSSRTHFTYVRTWSGFAYVSFVIDCFSRAVVGWHASTVKTTSTGTTTGDCIPRELDPVSRTPELRR